MEELLLPIFTAIIGVAGTLLALWYKHKLDLKKSLLIEENCVVAECVREDSAVVNKLKDVLSETNADRICIFSFHNGGYFYSGKSMQKMSMSYEVVDVLQT